MSQTETILLIVLGFSVASLIALFIGRLLWTAAVKVGARRMQRQVPTSLIGLQTERDRLRAEYAMLSQRLGARLETAKLQMAEHMAEVTRHRNRIHDIEAAEAVRTAEIRRLGARVAELEDALAAARVTEQDLRTELAGHQERIEKNRRRRKSKSQLSSETEPKAAAAAAPPPPPGPDDPERRLRQRIDRLTELAKAGPAADDVILAPAPPADPPISERMAEAERQTDDLTRDLEKLDAEWQERLAATGQPANNDGDGEADANVIPLANRIRDLKKGLGSAP